MTSVNTKLAMLASMATAMQKLPASAHELVNQPKVVSRQEQTAWVPPKDRKPNTNGLNRKARRRLASMVAHGKLELKKP